MSFCWFCRAAAQLFSKVHEINIKCHNKLTRDQTFRITSVILPEFRVENHGFVSAQSLFRIAFSIYLFVVRLKRNAVHFNSGHTISKKRICLVINKLNVVKEKAFSEAGFCTLATSILPVMISTGKNLVLWNFTYFNVVVYCVFFLRLHRRRQYFPLIGLFCEPLTKIICICMCNAH